MAGSHSKRKSPPPSNANSPSSKRQRLSPADDDDDAEDSLSSLSPADTNTRNSTPDETILSADQIGNVPIPSEDEDAAGDADDAEGDEEEDDDDDDDDADGEALTGHHVTSAKTVPGKQPRPLEPATSAKTNGGGAGAGASTAAGESATKTSTSGNMSRASVGGKGKRGEEALEHAVAAREEVERRRVELKDQPGGGGRGSKTAAVREAAPLVSKGEARLVNVKEEDEEEADVVVVHGEEAEEIAAPPRKERPAIAEERQGIIRFVVVTNDTEPESMIILTGLKNIFQKQLPKMPREYIARLVYDRAHYSMAIVKRGLEVVGGITYRPFEGQKFAEIVFCAITGTEQVKGYGSHLMNHLKDYVKENTSCMHFLTYADNYAIGYFKKQGFTKEIALERSVWAGYIKDYEGGTIMHCSMLPRVKYLEATQILAAQKEVILSKIRALSKSHVVHPGLHIFKGLAEGQSVDPSQVPGLKESGWTPEMDELTRRPKRGPHFAIMKKLLTLLVDHPSSWAFANPVNAAEVTDYYDVIKEPMDLATMENKLEANTYEKLDDFVHDAKLIFANCRQYNDPVSNYVKNADKLERYLDQQVKVYRDD